MHSYIEPIPCCLAGHTSDYDVLVPGIQHDESRPTGGAGNVGEREMD